MATQAQGGIVTPISGFQFEIYTLPNLFGNNFIPRRSVGFSEINGLSNETEAVEYKEGNDLYVDMLPGQTKPTELTLVKGVDISNYLRRWRALILERNALPTEQVRCTLIIVQYNRQGAPGAAVQDTAPIRTWRGEEAWPRSLTQADFSSTNSEINTETLVVCFKGPLEPELT